MPLAIAVEIAEYNMCLGLLLSAESDMINLSLLAGDALTTANEVFILIPVVVLSSPLELESFTSRLPELLFKEFVSKAMFAADTLPSRAAAGTFVNPIAAP